jgi:tryptophan synthase alpha chain
MNRIDTFFDKNRPIKRKALIAYLTVGYPTAGATLEIAKSLVDGGCDMIELGIPFSDPLADGATIQRASQRALESGITPQKCLEVAAELRKKVDIPLLFMGYYNPILHYGLDNFCAASRKSGIDGFIVPDLPPDEGSEAEAVMKINGLNLVYLVAPTSASQERLKFIAGRAQGFIYVVSLKGVTGAAHLQLDAVQTKLAEIRQHTRMPVGVGFGIRDPETAAAVAGFADAVIVGSALVSRVEALADRPDVIGPALKELVASMRAAMDAAA